MLPLMGKSSSTAMMTEKADYSSLEAHLHDLQDKSERWHTHTCSSFLNEEETAAMQKIFMPSAHVRWFGGYPQARKQKVIFLFDEEDDFSDIVCLQAKADQRFRKISHRDILGALMSMQIDRHAFGDFWITDDCIYLYTSTSMAPFLIDNLTRINQLSVQFEQIDDYPAQVFQMRSFTAVAASERADAIVAAITHVSRSKAKEMIHAGMVQFDHVALDVPDEVCHNNVTISIRGFGRFLYEGYDRKTHSDRIVAKFQQYI